MKKDIENKSIIVGNFSASMFVLLEAIDKQNITIKTLSQEILRLRNLRENPLLDNIDIAGIDVLTKKMGEIIDRIHAMDSIKEQI